MTCVCERDGLLIYVDDGTQHGGEMAVMNHAEESGQPDQDGGRNALWSSPPRSATTGDAANGVWMPGSAAVRTAAACSACCFRNQRSVGKASHSLAG